MQAMSKQADLALRQQAAANSRMKRWLHWLPKHQQAQYTNLELATLLHMPFLLTAALTARGERDRPVR